jgi:DNA-binding transcriptional LysR family regulator
MSLSIDTLRAFIILSEELHFGRAAARLHISQPALTKQIRKLETELGGRLFERTTGKVDLTQAGEALRDRTRALVADAVALESFARQAMQRRVSSLRIGFGIAVISDLLPKAVIAYRKSFPDVHLEMQDMGSRTITEGVSEGRLDLGFVRMPVTDVSIESLIVLREEIQIAVSAVRGPGPVQLADLRDDPFVLIARSTSETFQTHALNLCLSAGFSANVVQEAKEMFTLLNLVRAGLGVSLVPSTARRMRIPGVRFYPLKTPAAKWEIAMIWRRDRRSVIQPFIKVVKALIKQ